MLNQTTVTALQALLHIALEDTDTPVPPSKIAEQLGASQQYLSKIHTQLVKANILRAHRGVKGGVTLARAPKDITLHEIVEACQGKILGDYCQPHDDVSAVCGFHGAMHELQHAIVSTLGNWTLEDLRTKPQPNEELRPLVQCRMACANPQQD